MGASNLTNSELLAIIIKTGTKKYNCLEIARKILNDKLSNMSELEYLSQLSIEELKQYEGIGKIKAIQIKAVIEFSKRISSTFLVDRRKITCPLDIYNLVKREFIDKKQEMLKTIILNKSNRVISMITNGLGNTDKIDIGIKEILSEPIKQMANSIILVHNHPSGNLKPSKADISFTKSIIEYARIFDIEVLDHLIVSNKGYISLKESKFI